MTHRNKQVLGFSLFRSIVSVLLGFFGNRYNMDNSTTINYLFHKEDFTKNSTFLEKLLRGLLRFLLNFLSDWESKEASKNKMAIKSAIKNEITKDTQTN